jgi:hypothetical protein
MRFFLLRIISPYIRLSGARLYGVIMPTIMLEAQAQGLCPISGVRSSVDGEYRVSEATHSFSRDGGWVTVCDLQLSDVATKSRPTS